jgi:hypothetical protein
MLRASNQEDEMPSTQTISPDRIADIQAQLDAYTTRHQGHLDANDGYYPGCGCNPYQAIVYDLAEYDPEDERNIAIPEQVNEFVLTDGTTIEETGTGAWVIRAP